MMMMMKKKMIPVPVKLRPCGNSIITSTKEVMFSSALVCLFACQLQDYTKTTQPIFTKFGGKVEHGPRMGGGGNPDFESEPGILTEFLPL